MARKTLNTLKEELDQSCNMILFAADDDFDMIPLWQFYQMVMIPQNYTIYGIKVIARKDSIPIILPVLTIDNQTLEINYL